MPNTIIEQAVQDAQKKIQDLEAGITLLQELPELPDGARVHASNGARGRVYVSLPYNFDLYRPFRQQLCDAGWNAGMVFTVDNGWRYTELHRGDAWLTVILEAGLQGSTCTLVKVGEKTEPVYRAQCGE